MNESDNTDIIDFEAIIIELLAHNTRSRVGGNGYLLLLVVEGAK